MLSPRKLKHQGRPRLACDLPSALDDIAQIRARLGKNAAVFLDFDGTLSPIVDDPEKAHVGDDERHIIGELAVRFPVAVISGRSCHDIKKRLGLGDLVYAGSHGQEIEFRDGSRFEHPDSVSHLGALDSAESALVAALAGVAGVSIERKPFAIAVHTRRAESEEDRTLAGAAARLVAADSEGLVLRRGKEVHELRPDNNWDKGTTIEHLLAQLPEATVPLFIGDDETDEDGFAVVHDLSGVAILVDKPTSKRATTADYRLTNPGETLSFLASL